jgi:hypothetical protein
MPTVARFVAILQARHPGILPVWPQYTDHYFLLRRAAKPHREGPQIRAQMT